MKFFSSSVSHPACQDALTENREYLRRLYVRPQAGICYLDSGPESLCLTSFNGGHTPGNKEDGDVTGDPGSGGHTPGNDDGEIEDVRPFGFRWDEV